MTCNSATPLGQVTPVDSRLRELVGMREAAEALLVTAMRDGLRIAEDRAAKNTDGEVETAVQTSMKNAVSHIMALIDLVASDGSAVQIKESLSARVAERDETIRRR
jgi:hypothetical protein